MLMMLTGLMFAIRHGLALRLQKGRIVYLFSFIFPGYLFVGYGLGTISESKAPQDWLAWFLYEEVTIPFQTTELLFAFVLIRAALVPSSPARSCLSGQSLVRWIKTCLSRLFLLLPSPAVVIWFVFAVGAVQGARPGWQGGEVGVGIMTAFLCVSALSRWFSTGNADDSEVPLIGAMLLHSLIAVLIILLPTAWNATLFIPKEGSFSEWQALLVFGGICLTIILGYFLPRMGRLLTKRSC